MALNIPGMSTAMTDEQAYQYDAARSLATAADDLRHVADNIDRYAQGLVDNRVRESSRFPNVSLVREAMNEYRSVSNALMRLDAALESAMLADVERARAASPVEG